MTHAAIAIFTILLNSLYLPSRLAFPVSYLSLTRFHRSYGESGPEEASLYSICTKIPSPVKPYGGAECLLKLLWYLTLA